MSCMNFPNTVKYDNFIWQTNSCSIFMVLFQITMEHNRINDDNDLLVNKNLLETFIGLHQSQFQLSGVPEIFYSTLFDKLQNQVNLLSE